MFRALALCQSESVPDKEEEVIKTLYQLALNYLSFKK